MDERVIQKLQEAEMVLVGIGEEFAPELPKDLKDGKPEQLLPYYESRFYEELSDEHEVLQAYRKLRELIGEKPHFVVTLNTDDLIERGGFAREQVVAPCGSMEKLQCGEHIIEAKEIRNAVLAEAELASGQDGGLLEHQAEKLLCELAVCPECGAPLAFHTIENEAYLESGYLTQWESYKNWLAHTLNRKLCVLELGVGFRYPQVIRWPFEKTAFYNQKASFVRVHSKLPQIGAELAEKAVSIAQTPIELLLK